MVVLYFPVAAFGRRLRFYGQSIYLAELERAHGWPASLISAGTAFLYLLAALVVVFVAEAVWPSARATAWSRGLLALTVARRQDFSRAVLL
jgi:hypothetical protein